MATEATKRSTRHAADSRTGTARRRCPRSRGVCRVDRACLAFPILPGRGEIARDFLRELETVRKTDYVRAGERLGMTKALWFLVDGAGGAQVVVYLESTDAEIALDALVRSRDVFDRWFKARLAEATGLDLNDPPEGTRPAALLAGYADEDLAECR
jgi:hypothetical protein